VAGFKWEISNRQKKVKPNDGPIPDDAHVRGVGRMRRTLESIGVEELGERSPDEIRDLYVALFGPGRTSTGERVRYSDRSDRRISPAELIRSEERHQLIQTLRGTPASEKTALFATTVVHFDAMTSWAVDQIDSDESLSFDERTAALVDLAGRDNRWRQILEQAGRTAKEEQPLN